MDTSITCCLFAVLITSSLFHTAECAEPVDRDESDSALHVLSEGYLHNRQSFGNIDCKFTLTRTETKSTSDAIGGHFIGDAISYECLWLVNEGRVRFEQKCPEELEKESARILKEDMPKTAEHGDIDASGTEPLKDNAAEESNGQTDGPEDHSAVARERSINVPCSSTLLLRDLNSSYGLSFSELIECATLFPKGVRDGRGIRGTPFDMEVMAADEFSNPHRYLQDCIGGRFVGEYLGTESINGHLLEIVTVGLKGKPERMRFGFDPNRGYLPAYMSDRAPENGYKLIYEAFITDARKCSQDRWFPMRSVIVYPPRKPGASTRVTEILVTRLDVDKAPARNRFDIQIPIDYQVTVAGLDNQWLHVQQAMSVGPRDLEELHEKCIEYGKMYLARRRLPGGQGLSISTNWIRIFLVALFFVVLMLMVFLRLKRGRLPQ